MWERQNVFQHTSAATTTFEGALNYQTKLPVNCAKQSIPKMPVVLVVT